MSNSLRYCLLSAFFGSSRIDTSAAFIELIERRDDRQTADELRNQTVLDQILRLDVVEHVVAVRALALRDARRR